MSLVLDTGASRTVLGLDVLRFFNVTLDFERGQLTLVRIRPGQVRETTPAYQAPPAWAA